jgi:hypothetical protein
MKSNQPSLLFDFTSYVIGVLVGLFLILIAAWADMESTSYGFARLANAGLRGLSCPVLMTRDETRMISLSVSNKTDGRISPSIKTQISTSLLPEQFLENIELAPGRSKRLEWAVGPENIDLGSFIFAKVLLFSAYPLPSQEATCGIFVIDLPGNGQVILPVLLMLSLLGMAWGLHRINRFRALNKWATKYFGSMAFLALMIVLGLVIGFIGSWVPAVLVLVVALLISVILLSSLFLSDQKKIVVDRSARS